MQEFLYLKGVIHLSKAKGSYYLRNLILIILVYRTAIKSKYDPNQRQLRGRRRPMKRRAVLITLIGVTMTMLASVAAPQVPPEGTVARPANRR